MRSASVLSRLADILGMFSEERHAISVEEVEKELAVSTATAYRYVAELCHAGLLVRSLGQYTLGPKIIELEYLRRFYDPVIKLGEGLLNSLAEMTGCHVLFCNIYQDSLVTVFHASGRQPLNLAFQLFAQGRRMPLFRGSPSGAVLPFLDRRRLKRLYMRYADDPDVLARGRTWEEFLRSLKPVHKRGYYVSHGELDAEAAGIAAPIFGADGNVMGSLVLVYRNGDPPWASEEALAQVLLENAGEISRRIRDSAGHRELAR